MTKTVNPWSRLIRHALPLFPVALLTLISCALLLRSLDPLVFKDSAAYLLLADNILDGRWNQFAFRTPGYPVFLAMIKAATGSISPWVIAAVQVMLTSIIPYLLYSVSYLIIRQRIVASAVACMFFLSWPSLAMSVAVLTESLTQFVLLVTLALAVWFCEKPSVWLGVACAVFAAGLVMIRPAFLPLSPTIAVLCAFAWWRAGLIREHWKHGAVMLVLPLILIMCWCVEMKRQTGKFTISHITGVALLNQVSDQIANLETSDDPELVDLLQMAIENLNEGQHLNAGWDLVMYQEEKGVPAWETAERLKMFSIGLILKNPGLYFDKLTQNTKEYWLHNANYVYADSKTHTAAFTSAFPGLIYRAIDDQFRRRPARVTAVTCISLALSLYVMLFSSLGVIARTQFAILFSAVLICMLGHVLVNGADLARYKLPTVSLINLLSAMAVFIAVRDLLRAIRFGRGAFTQ